MKNYFPKKVVYAILRHFILLGCPNEEVRNIVLEKEKTMKDICERMLEGVGSKFGHDSNEYEMAGGKRKSERKRPIRKPKKTTP